MNNSEDDPQSVAAMRRRRFARENLDELARKARLVDAGGEEHHDAPGLYVRLFDVVEKGSGLQLAGGGGRSRGGNPDPIRLDVVDAIDAIARFALETERIQRRAMGWAPAVRDESNHVRKRWGLPPLNAEYSGYVPDERVLEALAWLQTHYATVDEGPKAWADDVAAQIAHLTAASRRLIGLARAHVAGAMCPYCEMDSIFLDPVDAELAVCVNVLCRDENGDPPEWRGWAQWAALDAYPASGETSAA